MAIKGPVLDRDAGRIRSFRMNLAIFIGVNVLLLVLLAGLVLAGYRLGGELWPYPVLMALWGARIAFQGYRAYRG